MLLHLFDRPVFSEEITAAAAQLGLPNLNIYANPAEVKPEDPAEIDAEKLATVLKMVARNSTRIDFRYSRGTFFVPMLTVFIFGDHTLTFAYRKEGISISEALNPNDLIPVMSGIVARCPDADPGEDVEYPISGITSAKEIVLDGSYTMPEGAPVDLLRQLKDNFRIDCLINVRGLEPRSIMLFFNEEVNLTVEESQNGLTLAVGSCLPMFQTVMSTVTTVLAKNIEAMQAAENNSNS